MHVLEQPDNVAAIESAVSAHVGHQWSTHRFHNLDDRASHPCGIHSGDRFDVFAKFTSDADGARQFDLECRGLRVLGGHGAPTARPIGSGVLQIASGTLLLLKAETERSPRDRTPLDWRAIGHALGELHGVHADTFGMAGLDGFFGPLPQDNRPVASNRWIDFFRERRVAPFLDVAIRSGHLPRELALQVNEVTDRLDRLAGPEPVPTLLHGDAQQNNFLSTDDGAVLVDVSPFFGHPENDIAMIDIFEPVPVDVLNGYRDVRSLDAEFARRKELWRIPVYLAIVAVGGDDAFGRTFLPRLAEALRLLR